MNKKKILTIGIIVLFILSGCSPAYRFVRGNEVNKGYLVKKGRTEMPYFTVDISRQYPQNLKLARERFKRRREFIEKYYRNEYPELFEGPFKSCIKFLSFYVFLPIAILREYFADSDDYEEVSEEEIIQFIERESSL
ncbi:MAG: hypothetical protein ABIH71_02900 [Candidatus Omnitrophota bacterium]|nr:hypothetical protein [Candidatus Omnitrophota bacterium]